MALGRISGPLLKSNLLRNGVDLAFETNLLYLDVTNRRVGINTSTPSNDLHVNGTTRITTLNVSGTATLGTISFSGNSITSTSGTINLVAGGSNPVVYQGLLQVGDLQLTGNTLSTLQTNENINFTTTGSGVVNVNSGLTVNGDINATGNLNVTGNITIGGNITVGTSGGGGVNIAAGVSSNILPATTNTYNLGSSSLYWNNLYANNAYFTSFTANNFNTANLSFTNNTISNTTTNANLNLVTNGTGGINIGNFKVTSNGITNTSANAITTFNETTSTTSFTGTISPGVPVTFTGSITGSTLTVTSTPTSYYGGALSLPQTPNPSWLAFSPAVSVGATPYTFECFVYLTSYTFPSTLLGATSSGGLEIQLASLGAITVIKNGSTTSNYSFASNMTTNTWYHIAVTKNAAGQEMAFLNGVASISSYGANLNFTGNTGKLGSNFSNSALFRAGDIAQVNFVTGNNVYDPTSAGITVPIVPLTLRRPICVSGTISKIVGPLSSSTTYTSLTGTSVGTIGTYNSVTQSATSGTGTGAVFTVSHTAASNNYASVTNISLVSGGSGYALGDTITLPGTSLGGTSPTNDLTFTVSTALASPWVATINSMGSTTGLVAGSAINATNGTGALYGGAPSSVVVTSIVSSTSITYTVTGGTTPVLGTVTSIYTPTVLGTQLLLTVASGSAYLTDSSTQSTKTLSQGGSTNVTYDTNSPFGSNSVISVGQVISGGSILSGTYITANLSGTGTSSASTWSISSYQTQTSTIISATPVTLTVASSPTPTGTIVVGTVLSGGSIPSGTFVTAFGTGSGYGSGLAGTYLVTPSQNITSTSITGTATGYVIIGGSNGVVIPAGTTLQRPGAPTVGMIRFNTDNAVQAVEVYNGTSWSGVAGVQSGITLNQASDTAVQYALTLG